MVSEEFKNRAGEINNITKYKQHDEGFKETFSEILLEEEVFSDFFKICKTYQLKKVARNCTNRYVDTKENIGYNRKETTAEHIYSSLKLADYFLISENEFCNLDKLTVYDLLLYHDDIEIETEDISISEEEQRKTKEQKEIDALPKLMSEYPKNMGKKLGYLDKEFRKNESSEAKFAHAIDKMDALIHELEYPEDRGPKNFTEENVKKRFQGAFEYSASFMRYFGSIVGYLKSNNYF